MIYVNLTPKTKPTESCKYEHLFGGGGLKNCNSGNTDLSQTERVFWEKERARGLLGQKPQSHSLTLKKRSICPEGQAVTGRSRGTGLISGQTVSVALGKGLVSILSFWKILQIFWIPALRISDQKARFPSRLTYINHTPSMASGSILFFLIYLFQLEDNYNIVMAFAIRQNEPAIGIHMSPSS